MAKNANPTPYFAAMLFSAAAACSANSADPSAPLAVTGGTTGTGAAPSGGSSAGGSPGAGGTLVGTGGSPFTIVDAAIDADTPVDLSGTWIAQVQSPGVLSVPTLGNVNANLGVVLRVVVTNASGGLSARFDICKMTAVTTPDPNALTMTFTPAVLATLTTSGSEGSPFVHVGDPVPLPSFTILSGITATGASVDADADTHPGITIPGKVGGQWPVNVYAGLTVPFSLTVSLTAANTLSGTVAFTANGTVFGSDSLWLMSGNIGVAPEPADVPITARLLAGDVPCSDVLTAFP